MLPLNKTSALPVSAQVLLFSAITSFLSGTSAIVVADGIVSFGHVAGSNAAIEEVADAEGFFDTTS